MSTMVFVDLPVTDLDRAKASSEGLGWSIDPLFTDEDAACVVVSESIVLMILRREQGPEACMAEGGQEG